MNQLKGTTLHKSKAKRFANMRLDSQQVEEIYGVLYKLDV